ncbi:MAG TPA: hypothetical protein PKA77_02765 [Chitinophagaceae bacterium]|jgi:hypothetical protein|nr:hypothetical protein [Chitinophagaceae bacterium]HMU57008.1 hypothetical protein [Chitinophagaceae bacterium]
MNNHSLQEFFQQAQNILKKYEFRLPDHHLRVYFELGDLNDGFIQASFSISYLPANLQCGDNLISVFANNPGEALDRFEIMIKDKSGRYPEHVHFNFIS